MPINAGHEYFKAEKESLEAQTLDEKIARLEDLIRVAPKHKSSENLLAELKTRLKKFLEKKEKSKKIGKPSQKGIKKENFQCALVGLPNSGKSYLLSQLTNAKPKVTNYPFSTISPEIGTMNYEGAKAQIIDLPSIGSVGFDQGIVNTADCIILVINSLQDLDKISPKIQKSKGEKIIAMTKSDLLDNEERRKLEETIKSKKIPALLVSSITGQNIFQLKCLIFQKMHIIRVYTKEPGKPSTKEPIVLSENSTVKDVAESILKGFSQKVKLTKLTGPSSKFSNQIVGLSHVCKDLDIVEFHTK